MRRIIPFVDHEIGYRLLQKLISRVDAGHLEIPAVVTTLENGKSWWPSVKDICSKAGVPLLVYDSSLLADNLLQHVDWFLLLSWKHIIPAKLIALPCQGVINLHYSLLPSYRGVYPVNWAIINGEQITGFTYHFVTDEIDNGEVFMQVQVPVYLSDTARVLQLRLDEAVFHHFDDFLSRLLRHDTKINCISEQKEKKSKGNYYSRKKFEQLCEIDLNKTYQGSEIFNLLRGLTFFEYSPNAFVIDKETGKRIYVYIVLREEQ